MPEGRILLTGATGHLGKALARGLVDQGAEVILTSRDRERANAVAEALGPRANAEVLDLSDIASIQDFKTQPLDGIVHNAYGGSSKPWGDIDADELEGTWNVGIGGPVLLTQHLWEMLNDGASVVFIASMYAHVSPQPSLYGPLGIPPNPLAYGAAKAGLVQAARYLAALGGPRNIRVNSVSPGPFPANPSEEFANELGSRTMLGRIGGPDEIIGPVLFLLSHASSYVTGADLRVDGGWTAW